MSADTPEQSDARARWQRKNHGTPLVVVAAKITPAEAEALAAAARAAGVTRSAYLRSVIIGAVADA